VTSKQKAWWIKLSPPLTDKKMRAYWQACWEELSHLPPSR
jgi:hypothetical protein